MTLSSDGAIRLCRYLKLGFGRDPQAALNYLRESIYLDKISASAFDNLGCAGIMS